MEMASTRKLLFMWKTRKRDHMIQCPAQSWVEWRIKTITELWKRVGQLNTKFELEETLCSAIAEWFETGHVLLYKYPEKFYKTIWSQGVIGWRQIFNGKLSWYWLRHQGNTKTTTGRVQMDYIWGASIAETYLWMMIDLWEIRDEEVYDKEETAKQQKRKAKTAISVWKLHELQD